MHMRIHIETIRNYETVSPIIIYQSAEKTHVSFNIVRLVYYLNCMGRLYKYIFIWPYACNVALITT